MTNWEVFELLKKIDGGYLPTQKEVEDLSCVKTITWRNIWEIPESIGYLSNLQRLNLSETQIKSLPESIGDLSNLLNLSLHKTLLSYLPESLGNLSNLQSLSLSSTPLSSLPKSIEKLLRLERLYLGSTMISSLPESIGNLSSLQYLELSSTRLRNLPESIGYLPMLKTLILEENILFELPESLLHLNLEYLKNKYRPWAQNSGIYIYGLKLQNQPVEIFSQNRELIIGYYESAKAKAASPINECKVVFLGDGGAGKSLIIDRLMHDGNISDDFDGESTPGICISSQKYQIGNEKITLHFWDFGGQAIMHSMHRLFLTNRTLYVVVTNARDNKANDQAWYWIRNVKSFANGAPVLLLVNHKDQNPSANVNENGLRKEYPELKQVRIVSGLKDTKEVFDRDIRDVICQMVTNMETVHTSFSASWLSLMNNLQNMRENYITSDDFYKMCSFAHVDTDKKHLDQIISWYQDLGVCFYSREHPVSAHYMVLKPIWLLNALYILIFNGRKYATNGIIPENAIYKLICEKVSNDVIKKVRSDIKYQPNEIQYIINVLLNYELIYRLDNEYFFIPMLCDENEPSSIESYDSIEAFHIRFVYEYLPDNVLHRLMVRHGYELNTNIVWRTGALFKRERLGWSCLVRINNNKLDVYAKADDQEIHPVNSYLDMIRESVNKINDVFGLMADEQIAYRRGDKEDYFNYEALVGSLRANQDKIYSCEFKDLIDIKIVLGIINKMDDLVTQEVIKHMISSLSSMSQRSVDLSKRNEVELTADFQNNIELLLNSKYGLQITREYTMGRAKKKIGETDLYFFICKDGIKKDMYILENKNIDDFSEQYMQLMGYLNPNFSAGITLSINKKKGWEEAYDFICEKLNFMKNVGGDFAPLSINRHIEKNGTRYIETQHIVPETELKMPVYHLVMQLSDKTRHLIAKEARK